MTRKIVTNSQEMLLLFVQWKDGDLSVNDMFRQVMTHDEVQDRINSLRDDFGCVSMVKVMDLTNNHVEDISDEFDLRDNSQLVADLKEARERAFEAPAHNAASRLQRAYGTLNHAQQGI